MTLPYFRGAVLPEACHQKRAGFLERHVAR
jgi:hypothetical protein